MAALRVMNPPCDRPIPAVASTASGRFVATANAIGDRPLNTASHKTSWTLARSPRTLDQVLKPEDVRC